MESVQQGATRHTSETGGRGRRGGDSVVPTELLRAAALPAPEEEQRHNGHGTPGGPINATELMEMEFAPTNWVVPDVLPEGVTILAAKPKKGKSWMALGLCEAVAAGGVAFGTKRVDQGETLYLALEDNPKRLKKRLKKVLDGRGAPEKMYLHTEWPRLDQGGAVQLDEWLTEHPDARLVVIDTLAKIRKPATGANVYTEDYAALEPLLPIAAEHGVAIIVVHHLRKAGAADPMDEISSSFGLTGGVDGFMILRRLPGSKGPTLFVEGRDIEEPTEYALHWNHNTATWTIEGEAEEVHVSKERADILLTLNRNGTPMTPREVSDALGPSASYGSVKKLMWTMLGAGQLLKNNKGAYYPAKPTTPNNFGNPGNPAADSGDAVTGLPGSNRGGNPAFTNIYGENGHSVTEVTEVGRGGELPPVEERHTEQGRPQEGMRRSSPEAPPRPVEEQSGIATTKEQEEKPNRRLSAEEAEEVQRLICEGMSATQARAEVLREGMSP